MAKTLMTTTIVRSKETTTHGLGHFDSTGSPVLDAELEIPCSLSIVLDNKAIYLWRLNEGGECIADTWHMTIVEAQSQAEFEFEIDPNGWKNELLT